jgi:hypothetical protein
MRHTRQSIWWGEAADEPARACAPKRYGARRRGYARPTDCQGARLCRPDPPHGIRRCQMPGSNAPSRLRALDFGAWDFFGIWVLGFGISSSSHRSARGWTAGVPPAACWVTAGFSNSEVSPRTELLRPRRARSGARTLSPPGASRAPKLVLLIRLVSCSTNPQCSVIALQTQLKEAGNPDSAGTSQT